MNILVVDDNPTNRLLLRYMMQSKGHNVSEAEDGSIAIDLVKKGDYDIIFMDMMMPVMDGYEATKTIREFDENILIYVVSAYQEKEFPDDWKTIKYDGILSKPIELSIITDIIDKHNK